MAEQTSFAFTPLVRGETTAKNPNVRTIMDQMDDETYYIPDYQRDSSQWDNDKKSLFIESLVNNMTVPPLLVCPDEDSDGMDRRQVVDGQQRLTTIREYLQNKFALSSEADVEYEDNVGPLIQGKKFSELPEKIRKQIERYVLNIIVLPKGLPTDLRRKIFRRINEAGVPLSAHDLRLADFSDSKGVTFIRLAGIFDPARDGSRRMIESAKNRFDMDYPWKDNKAWSSWWADTLQSVGQAASQMFLYYVIARDMKGLDALLESPKTIAQLGMKYDGTTIWVLDLYCAQLKRQEQADTAQLVADPGTLAKWFADFEAWFNKIKMEKIPRIKVNSSTKVAFFIAAASQYWADPGKPTPAQWELIQVFLTEGPNQINTTLSVA
jgi:hypothetical protein